MQCRRPRAPARLPGQAGSIYDGIGSGWMMRMWLESRQLLALLGGQKVTIASFLGLLLYGAIMIARRGSRSNRLRAIIIFGSATASLVVVLLGLIPGDLSQWSSLAVFLFAIGIEGSSRASVGAGLSRKYRVADRATSRDASVAAQTDRTSRGERHLPFHSESLTGPHLSN